MPSNPENSRLNGGGPSIAPGRPANTTDRLHALIMWESSKLTAISEAGDVRSDAARAEYNQIHRKRQLLITLYEETTGQKWMQTIGEGVAILDPPPGWLDEPA